jgi:hypothetical protein
LIIFESIFKWTVTVIDGKFVPMITFNHLTMTASTAKESASGNVTAIETVCLVLAAMHTDQRHLFWELPLAEHLLENRATIVRIEISDHIVEGKNLMAEEIEVHHRGDEEGRGHP